MKRHQTDMALTELAMYKEYGLKPNFSELSRKTGLDRHTLRKYWREGGKIDKKRERKRSKYDGLAGVISERMASTPASIRGIWFYLKSEYPSETEALTYRGLVSYVRANGLLRDALRAEAHPRFETAPGEQLQVDWKESIKTRTAAGETLVYNVFSATLSYSRMHYFVISEGKGTVDFMRCLIEVLRRIGGLPGSILTDNMPAVVSCTGGGKRKLPQIRQLESDLGCKVVLCRVRTPQTKGKVESSNRFVNWLGAFDGKVSCLADVARKLAALERECSSAPNREIGVPPLALLGRERESLRRLPSRVVLETYAAERYVTQKVPQTMLVRCRSKEYSVPRSMIGKRAVAIPSEGRVYVFDSAGELVAEHSEGASRINYSREHYLEGLSDKAFGDDLEEMAVKSLERLGAL